MTVRANPVNVRLNSYKNKVNRNGTLWETTYYEFIFLVFDWIFSCYTKRWFHILIHVIGPSQIYPLVPYVQTPFLLLVPLSSIPWNKFLLFHDLSLSLWSVCYNINFEYVMSQHSMFCLSHPSSSFMLLASLLYFLFLPHNLLSCPHPWIFIFIYIYTYEFRFLYMKENKRYLCFLLWLILLNRMIFNISIFQQMTWFCMAE